MQKAYNPNVIYETKKCLIKYTEEKIHVLYYRYAIVQYNLECSEEYEKFRQYLVEELC